MAQRAALLVDGTHVGISAGRRGMELDYSLLLKYVKQGGRGRVDGGFDRDIVVARVYVGPTANPTRGRRRFLDYLARLGYQASVCQEGGSSLKTGVDQEIMHDILVLTLTGRVDAIVLVTGDAGFMKGIRTAQSHGVQVEVLGFAETTAEVLMRETQFHDLVDTVLLHASGAKGDGP